MIQNFLRLSEDFYDETLVFLNCKETKTEI